MKKISLILIFLLAAMTLVYGQRRGSAIKWLHISAKGGYGNSIFINKNVFDDDNVKPYFLSPSYFYGGRLGLSIGDYIGFFGEVQMTTFGESYDMKLKRDPAADFAETYTKDIKIQSLDYAFYFRYMGDMGGFFEIGPRFTNIKTIEVTNTGADGENFLNEGIDHYETKLTGVSVGFGQSIIRTDRFTATLGARINYAFGDMRTEFEPIEDGVYNVENYSYNPEFYESHAKTSPLTIQITLEVDYIFGFWGDASCGRGRLMFFQ